MVHDNADNLPPETDTADAADAGALPDSIDPADLDLSSEAAGPKGTKSLLYRRAPLASTATQLELLESADLAALAHNGDFDATLAACGWPQLRRSKLEIFQINIGKLCNMTCKHCHVDSGPDRTEENMDRETVDACLHMLDACGAHTVDITGGAPELNPHFRYLVEEVSDRGKHVIDRCNLTILMLPRFADLPEFLAEHNVEVVCSLPHYRKLATDSQRGKGTYEKSIDALRKLNAVGYGQGDPDRMLTLMSNPAGSVLAGSQASMETEWKRELERNHGVTFDRLICLNNMPISRFLEWLEASGNFEAYMQRLVNAFNPATVGGVMCRNTISIGWDGTLYDCDFNQMLDLTLDVPESALAGSATKRPNIRDINPDDLLDLPVVTRRHCFGCTAGAGSSCGGAIE